LKEAVADLSYNILKHAEQSGANVLVTACPLCEYNLGPRQPQIKKQYSSFDSMPVVYFTQLMALAFGIKDSQIGFENNQPDPQPILEELGLMEK
jgi:heterodisulfide reductase subunit B